MQAKYVERIWLAGGALAVAVLVALTWFLLISPRHTTRDELRAQTDVAEVKVTSLQRRLNELRKQQANLDQYKAKLDQQRLALPSESSMDALLLEMRDAGAASDVAVGSMLVAPAVEVAGSGKRLYEFPVTLISNGTGPNQERFLTQLQQVQPRAVLIGTANLTVDKDSQGFDSKITMTLNVHVFTAPETD